LDQYELEALLPVSQRTTVLRLCESMAVWCHGCAMQRASQVHKARLGVSQGSLFWGFWSPPAKQKVAKHVPVYRQGAWTAAVKTTVSRVDLGSSLAARRVEAYHKQVGTWLRA